MALIWMDGFDHYGTDTARMTEGPYDQVDAAFTLSEVNPRTGARCLRRDSSAVDDRIVKNFESGKLTVGSGVVVNLSALPNSDFAYSIASLTDSTGDDQLTLAVNMDGSVRALLGSVNGTEIADSESGVITTGIYTHVELAVKSNSEVSGILNVTNIASFNLTEPNLVKTRDLSSLVGLPSGSLFGGRFDPSGTRLFMFRPGTSGRIYQFDCSIPHDMDTATYTGNSLSLSGESSPQGFSISSDGTKIIVTGLSTDKLRQYNLSSAWQLNTAIFFGSSSITFLGPFDVKIADEQNKIFVLDVPNSSNVIIKEYSGSNVDSLALVDTFNLASIEPLQARSFDIATNGKDLILCGNVDEVISFKLSDIWTVSGGITLNSSNQDFITPTGSPLIIDIKNDSSSFFVGRATGINSIAEYAIEVTTIPGDNDGIIEVRVNGVTVISKSGLTTRLSDETGYSGITLNCGGELAHGVTTDIDDWYIWDDQGAWNNSFLGDRRCLLMKPNQDTNIADFDPSSGSFGYKMIDDDSPDDDATYIIAEAYLQSGSPLTGTSEFEIENLPDGTSLISAVNVVTRASKTDSTSAEVFTSINSGVNSLSQAAHVLATSYRYYNDLYEYDPATIANITRDGFSSLTVSVTADDLDPGAESPGAESPGAESPGGDPDFDSVESLLHFDGSDGSTTFTDQIGRTWSATGDAQLDTAFCKFGPSSLLLDGSGDAISTPDAAGLQFDTLIGTLELFLYLHTAVSTNFNGVVDKWTGGGPGYMFDLGSSTTGNRGKLRMLIANVEVVSASTIATEQWVHIAGVLDGTNATLFIDGISQGSVNIVGKDASNAGHNLFIGGDGLSSLRNQNMSIDEFRLTKGVARYTSNFTPPTAPFEDF